MSSVRAIKKGLEKGCDDKYKKLFNYTKKDLQKIANKYNIHIPCGMKKKYICSYITDELSTIEMKNRVEYNLTFCQKELSKFQSTQYLKKIGNKNACKLLPIVTQQILWLLDRHVEYESILKADKSKQLSKLIMLASTIEGQCNRVGSIFKNYIQPQETKKWWIF